jgi:hypothetical protein
MSDQKALYVVRATPRNISGAAVAFEVATGIDASGRPTFSGETRQIPPGRRVLVAGTSARGGVPTGVYRVSQGSTMAATETQPLPGDLVRITCTPEDVKNQAGTLWMVTDDSTVVLSGFQAVPAPAPTPEPVLQPEGGTGAVTASTVVDL